MPRASSAALQSDSGDNLTRYNNADFDQLLTEFRAIDDPESPEAFEDRRCKRDPQRRDAADSDVLQRGQRVHTECISGDIVLNAFDFVEVEKVTPTCG